MALRRFITNSFANGSLTMNKFANDAFYFVGIENIYHANSTYGAVAGLPAFNIPNSGSFAVIKGRNFSNTVTVLIDGTATPAVSVVNNSTVNIQTPVKTNGTYDVYVINSDGTFALRPAGITFVDYPVWVTSNSLPSTIYNSSYSTQLVATGGTITYNLTDGSSLPAFLQLNSNGLITSTSNPPNHNLNTYSFSIDAYSPSSNVRVARQFTIFSSDNEVEMMLVAGGGAGHGQGGGGGGGGMLLYTSNTAVSLKTPNGNSFTLSVNSALVVNVGSGGVYSGATATRGGNTTVVGGGLNYSAFGGGSGASRDHASPNVAGGSGGGGGSGAAGGSNAGGAGTAGQGFNGSDGTNSTGGGGGGGGASQAGSSGGNYLGKGGDGHAISLEGTSIYYAGGGGAGGTSGFAGGGGAGGLGGGGGGTHGQVGGGGSAGGTLSSNAAPGTYGVGRVNSGGGGGGGTAYNGGSGVVVMRHSRQYPPANVTGGAFTSNTDNYFRWYNITANCTITFYNFGEPQWITATSLPFGQNSFSYSSQLTANQATNYSLDPSSTLPDWLTLYSNGLLYSAQVNVATIPSSFTFAVLANNSSNLIAKKTFTLQVAPNSFLRITPNTSGLGERLWSPADGALTFSTPNTYTVEALNTFNLVVDLKGAGGGPGGSAGYAGGAGGRAQGTIAMVSGRTYKLVVGSSVTTAGPSGPYGGGANGGGTGGPGAFGGAGGGYTGIFVTEVSQSNSVIIAGGGGGGPGNDVASVHGNGGQGGGTSGQAGTSANLPGQGGTPTAGGSGGGTGAAGSALLGGVGGPRGGNQGSGGGGGGGFWGGGGGAAGGFGPSGQTGSGAGGGSSYLGGHSNAATSSTSTTQGGGSAAAANGSAIFS